MEEEVEEEEEVTAARRLSYTACVPTWLAVLEEERLSSPTTTSPACSC